ncbi:MAG: DUF1853 family protein [Gammaproteobacteria bacterium]|nr:DUF1853 family protein [Gammaproteobacteria bacterium]
MKDILEYSQYTDPQVRALVWSLLSPGLVNESGAYPACVNSDWCRDIYQRIQPYLQSLDAEPTELREWLEKYKSWRLGIRFEAYWSFIFEQLKKQNEYLTYSDHTQILGHSNKSGLNLSSAKKLPLQTMGELDYIYQDNDKKLHHLEIAAKFYLLKQDEFGFERLIGPNGGDWYERKLEHLFKKQLPLSNTQEAKEKLAEQFQMDVADVNCEHHGLIKGMIFFPVTAEGSLTENERQCLNPNFLTGSWGTINNWYLSDPGEIGRWVILDKLSWLEPQVYSLSQPKLEDILYTAKEMSYKLKIHFHSTRRSILIARLDFDEEKQLWLEQQRVMVVDKYWPAFKRSIENMFKLSESRPRDIVTELDTELGKNN